MEIIVEEFIKSEKLLQILIKLLNPQILFCKSEISLQIRELSLNPEKYFANPKKYFVTCYLRQQSATNSGLPHPRWRSFVRLVLVGNPGGKFCFKCGSKVAGISHPSARISTFEDERASSSSSSKSLSQYFTSKAEERRGSKFNKPNN